MKARLIKKRAKDWLWKFKGKRQREIKSKKIWLLSKIVKKMKLTKEIDNKPLRTQNLEKKMLYAFLRGFISNIFV